MPEGDLYGEGQNLLAKHFLDTTCLYVDIEVLEGDNQTLMHQNLFKIYDGHEECITTITRVQSSPLEP